MPNIWKRRPELLLLPQIPKPLHGVNPRSMLGSGWWDKTRKEAYQKTNFRCMACGVHKSKARFQQHLEGHEVYSIDYTLGISTYVETVALCPACHKYIHQGRLRALLDKRIISQGHYASVIQWGNKILTEAGLDPTIKVNQELAVQENIRKDRTAEWAAWRLHIDLSQERTKVHNKYHKTHPKGSRYIGRGSPYGNPFAIGADGSRDEVCDRFESEILPELNVLELLGKDLVCYCKPARCHGDSILNAIYTLHKFKPKFQTYEQWLAFHYGDE